MAKRFGVEYPERADMSILSDLLGIPHFATSRGSTVKKDFLLAVAEALGAPQESKTKKDDVLAAAVVAATGSPMDPSLLSRGGTVTDAALQTIIRGIVNRETTIAPKPAEISSIDLDGLGSRDRELLVAQEQEAHDVLRQQVFDAYEEKCALTSVGLAAALDVARIVPQEDGGPALVSNGLLLRRDLVAMFGKGLLAIHEVSLRAVLHPKAIAMGDYESLPGTELRLPSREIDRPAPRALRIHRLWAGL